MFMGAEPDTEWLRQYPQLQNLEDPAWRQALRHVDIIDVPAGTTVFRPGDPCVNLLFLVEGQVRVYMSGDNGREIVLSHLKGGDLCVFTLTSLLQAADYSAAAVTEQSTRAATLPVMHFRELFACSRGFQDFILHTMAQRMHETLLLLQEIAFEGLEMRLACYILRHTDGIEGAAIELTHQQVASEIGTTREMVSRLLKEMEQRGCVRLKRKRIELVDADRLETLSSGSG